MNLTFHRHALVSRKRRRGSATRGFTLIETLFATTMVLTGLLIIATSLTRSKLTRVEAEQDMSATATLSEAAGALRARGITSSWQSYFPSIGGAPFPAAGSGPGPHFLAPGLNDAVDPKKPAEVAIRFFTDETADLPEFGLPRDLDGDGAASNANTAQLGSGGQLMATILPYALSITFRGPGGGTRTVTWQGVLTNVR
jgi:type II secretory pathway pseudopilin PulG